MSDPMGKDLPGIFVSDEVRRNCARAIAHFGEMARQNLERWPPPPEIVQRDPLEPQRFPLFLDEEEPEPAAAPPVHDYAEQQLDGAADRLIRAEIRPLLGKGKRKNHRFEVVNVGGKRSQRRGTYATIRGAQDQWPRAILTPAARALALELENGKGGQS